jgi:hypothetical protein
MTTAEKIYHTVKELPESELREVLDFAEFLKQKKKGDETKPGSLAQRIHQRFKGLYAENIPIPPRQLSRTPPLFEE